jgi:uncharacterized protein YbjT (DUF2867 family)
LGIRDDLERQPDPINALHADIEHVIERSGLEWTFLRPGGFATNTLWWAPQIRADEGRAVGLRGVRPGCDSRAGPRGRGGPRADRRRAWRGDIVADRPPDADPSRAGADDR